MTEMTNTKGGGERLDGRERRFSRLTAVIVATVYGVAGAAGSIYLFESYGIGLFVVLPVVVGFVSVALASLRTPVGFGTAILMSFGSIAGIGALFLGFGLEGGLCLIMAVPLWGPGAILGAVIAVVTMRWVHGDVGRRSLLGVVVLSLPITLGAEPAVRPEPTVYRVTSSVVIDAPAQAVWDHVVGFDELPEPTTWLFTHGVAYPTHARIEGRGVGAMRHCVFSTGSFVEPITAWDEPRLLAFDVVDSPPPMTEWSFYEHVHAPHLHGFFESRKGQFKLTEQPDGTTLLEGTTWYVHGIAPEGYWRLWSDYIIHAIHHRVLTHIRQLAEAAP